MLRQILSQSSFFALSIALLKYSIMVFWLVKDRELQGIKEVTFYNNKGSNQKSKRLTITRIC